jgi:Rrf2 family protein
MFSRRVGYAAHALCLMAQMQPLATVPVAELARRMARAWPRTSATYLCKVVQALVEAGILASVRGSAGGYCLAQRASGVSLLDLVYALEGPLDGGCLLTPNGPCESRARCGNYSMLRQLQSEFSQLLSAITIEQLARNLPRSIDGAETGLTCTHLVRLSADP